MRRLAATLTTILGLAALGGCMPESDWSGAGPRPYPGATSSGDPKGQQAEQLPSLPARPTPPVDVAPLTVASADTAARRGAGPNDTPAASPYAGWSTMIFAGDDRASEGGQTRAFDNARRDVRRLFLAWGLPAMHMRHYTATSDVNQRDSAEPVGVSRFGNDLARLKMRSGSGCLFYITSHGEQTGVTFGAKTLAPDYFWSTVDRLCGRQPVIAVISACYSGVFAAPAYQTPNRFILTAASSTRPSFGCGQDNVYPYFDGCFLESAKTHTTWTGLAEATRRCVARLETEQGLSPSNPQFFVGREIKSILSTLPVGAQTITTER